MLARCPHCREVFDAPAPGQQSCPKCGGALYVPPPVEALPAAAPISGPGAPAAQLEEKPPALEATPRGPLFPAFVETLKQVLTEPARFFERLPPKGSTAAPLGFAIAVLWAGMFVDALLERAMASPADNAALLKVVHELLGDNPAFGTLWPLLEHYLQPSTWSSVLLSSLFVTPLAAAIGLYVTAGLNHLLLMLPGKAPRGFDATFRATAYACAPALCLAVPKVGGLIALVWAIVLMTMGLARVHKVPSAASFAAVIAPYIVLCCGSVALGVALIKLVGGVK